MRVLLIATNRHDKLQSRLHAQPMPIGLAYIAGHLDHERHEVKVLDLMFSNDHLADLEATVKEFQPQMVGMSVRNLSNHSYMNTIWALPVSKEVIDHIRTVSDAVIVCGGPAFSIMPSECFEYLGADLGLSGDAGETRESVDNKLEFLRSINPAVANLRVGVSVMPGTEVAGIAKKEGLIKDESELVKPTFYIADEVKPWIVDYLKEQVEKDPRWNLS